MADRVALRFSALNRLSRPPSEGGPSFVVTSEGFIDPLNRQILHVRFGMKLLDRGHCPSGNLFAVRIATAFKTRSEDGCKCDETGCSDDDEL